MSATLYSQWRNESWPPTGYVRSASPREPSDVWLRLVNENDAELCLAHRTFVALMSLAEQRGWRATAFTRSDLNIFSATDASRCAVVLNAALEDGIPPMVAVAARRTAFPVIVDSSQVQSFREFCQQGGFWIRPTEQDHAGESERNTYI